MKIQQIIESTKTKNDFDSSFITIREEDVSPEIAEIFKGFISSDFISRKKDEQVKSNHPLYKIINSAPIFSDVDITIPINMIPFAEWFLERNANTLSNDEKPTVRILNFACLLATFARADAPRQIGTWMLLQKASFEDVERVILQTFTLPPRESLNIVEWMGFVEGVDEYLTLPMSWWIPMIRPDTETDEDDAESVAKL